MADLLYLSHNPVALNCGVAENRTRVQTSHQKAFYTFSFFMIFDNMLIKNTLHITYLLNFKTASKRYNFYVNIYDASKRTPLTKAFKRHSAFLPSRTRLDLTKIQIKQLKRSYSRRLNFEIAFYEIQFHYSTCLQINKTRCQNQSTPLMK